MTDQSRDLRIAEQRPRVVDDNKEQYALSTTLGAETFLSTDEFQLRFEPAPFAGWQGEAKNHLKQLVGFLRLFRKTSEFSFSLCHVVGAVCIQQINADGFRIRPLPKKIQRD